MYQGLVRACWRPGSVSGAHTQLPSVGKTSQQGVSTGGTWNPTCTGWKGTNLRWVGGIQGQKFPTLRAAAIEAPCSKMRPFCTFWDQNWAKIYGFFYSLFHIHVEKEDISVSHTLAIQVNSRYNKNMGTKKSLCYNENFVITRVDFH